MNEERVENPRAIPALVCEDVSGEIAGMEHWLRTLEDTDRRLALLITLVLDTIATTCARLERYSDEREARLLAGQVFGAASPRQLGES